MVIKLVQTDTIDPLKITLSKGEHSFGRGKLLGCNDKRISRNHGQLEAYDDHIEIKALHQNPCFYIKNGTEDKQILRKDSVISLNNGDRFGLLPDAFWYEVLYCTDKPSEDKGSQDINTEEYCTEQNTNGSPDETINDNVCQSTESPSIISPTNENTSDSKKNSPTPQNQDVNTDNGSQKSSHNEQDNKVTVKRSYSTDQGEESKKIKIDSVEVKTEPPDTVTESVEVKTEPADVKTEPVNIKTEPINVKTEPKDVKPGPSLDQLQSNATVNNNAASPANTNRPLRERCMYGANCYRRNPTHLAQFSHPRDDDWGDGPRAPCPFGATCSRVDPRHHRDHYHPPGHVPPPPPGRRRQRRGSSYSPPPGMIVRARKKDRLWSMSDEGSNSSDDSCKRRRAKSPSSPPGLIVQGKRKRKTLQMAESDDSDEEKDPYGTDESDEWCPETGESQDF